MSIKKGYYFTINLKTVIIDDIERSINMISPNIAIDLVREYLTTKGNLKIVSLKSFLIK